MGWEVRDRFDIAKWDLEGSFFDTRKSFCGGWAVVAVGEGDGV